MKKEMKICPKCGGKYLEYPAVSRIDNKTEICPDCGLKEAIAEFLNYEYGDEYEYL